MVKERGKAHADFERVGHCRAIIRDGEKDKEIQSRQRTQARQSGCGMTSINQYARGAQRGRESC